MPRSQAEILDRFETVRGSGEDLFGFRQEALLEAMELDAAERSGVLREDFDRAKWTPPDVARSAREYLVFAVGKAVDHRGISASRSVEKFGEWLWCLGDDELAARFEAAGYAPYGAPQLQVLVEAWQVEHEHADDPSWLRMVQGMSCEPGCQSGCGE